MKQTKLLSIIRALSVIICLVLAVSASAYDFVQNGIYYNVSGTNATVTYKDTNFNSYSGTVNIPTTVTHEGNTYTVTAIGTSAFRQCDALTSVSIPNTVTVIGYASFYKCSALTSLTIPNSVLTIEDQALRESGLVQITIGNQVTSIGNGCFYNCQSLTSVNIPNSVTTLGTLCFQDCAALQSATLGTGLTTIPQQCFTYCEALSSISIPSNVDVISAYAFYDTGLTSISLTEGLDSIYYGAFGGCESLTSITFPASVSFIDDLVLEGCYSLAEIIVDSTNPYYSSLYNELYNKQHSRLLRYPPQKPVNYAATPSSCVQIDAGAYSGAVHLESITIGPNVTQIGVNAFEGCTGLIKFIVPEENTHYMADDGVLYTKVDGNPQSIIKYPAEKPGKHYSLPNTTDTIAIRAFERTSKFESVYIPSSVKAMASAAFESSTVKRVVIDEGLKIIPDYAFYTCANLESVYLPSTITSIGYRAFYYSVSLAEMTIAVNGQAPAIEAESFYGLGYYTDNRYATVYVPSGMASQYEGLNDWLDARGDFTDISSIAAETEFTVDSLKYITTDANLNVKVDDVTSTDLFDPGIPPKVAYQGNLCTVTLLGDHSLANCTRMIRAEVPFTATVVDGYAFYGSTPIEKMTLHEGLQRLSQFSLSHINGLTSLTIPASVDSISGTFVTYSDNLSEILVKDGNAKYTSVNGVLFSKNKKLLVAFPHANSTDYTVPYGTTVIGDNSFRGAKTLHSVDLPNSLQEIQYSAFTDNIGLTSITVPTGVTVIGNSAFSNCTSMTSAELPSTLTALGYLAFHNTPNLTTLTVKNPTPPTCEVKMDPRTHTVYYVFDDSHYSSVQLIVPRGSKAAYQAADTWKNFTNIIEADFAPEYKRGDVNNDNSVDIDDVTQLISYVLGNGNSINQYAADVNEDGGIDIDDITVIINYILNGVWPEPADIDMWYLIGDHVGFSPWLNTPEAIGIGLIPLYPSGEFNASGRGLLTYTGYFSSTDYLMLIHRPGYWEERWGIDDDGQFCIDEDNNGFHAETSGYYTIRLNTVTNELSFTPYTATNPGVFTTMAMPGNHNGWVVTDVAFNMGNINTQKENHDWMMQSVTFGSDDELKFAADNAWEFNWGSEEFPYGTGIPYGMNIPVVAGTYDIFFNDITGQFNFISK